MKQITIVAIMFSLFAIAGCSSQNKQDIKQGLTEVGHATRDATTATGHFFRDTTKDVIKNIKDSTNN